MFGRLLLSLTLLSLVLSPLPARARQQKIDLTELEKVALEELKEENIPGAAIAIVSGDQIAFVKGFGVANVETGSPVTPDMLFRIGSVNKTFTAALLVTLAEEGKLKLDDPIGAYIKDLNPSLAKLTAHHLISHTAGLRSEEAGALQYGLHDESMRATAVRSWNEGRLFTESGKVFSYSNDGYVLAGLLIEAVGGRPYADQLSEQLFKPLGMTSTTLRPTMAMTYPYSQGHNAFGKAKPAVVRPFSDNAVYWPAGFMFSSVQDLARFAIAFMNGGQIDGKQVLAPSVIAKLSTARADIPIDEKWKYGYGLFIRDYRGVRVVEHYGGIAGFGAMFRMVPDKRFAVIVLANKLGGTLGKAAEKAMELFLPLEAKPKVEEDKAKKSLPMSEAEMANYAGVYSYRAVSYPPQTMEIVAREGKLFLKIGSQESPVTKIADNTFFTSDKFPVKRFALVPGADGKAEFLHFSMVAFKRIQPGK